MGSPILKLYRKLDALPFGGHVFNLGVGLRAPFFGKINPDIFVLRDSICKVRMKDRWSIRNHLGTVNAGAMCTLAELTGGLALDATIPSELRWIPKGMTVSYLMKGEGVIESTCEFDSSIIQVGDILLPVILKNSNGEEVFSATIVMYITRKNVRKTLV